MFQLLFLLNPTLTSIQVGNRSPLPVKPFFALRLFSGHDVPPERRCRDCLHKVSIERMNAHLIVST